MVACARVRRMSNDRVLTLAWVAALGRAHSKFPVRKEGQQKNVMQDKSVKMRVDTQKAR